MKYAIKETNEIQIIRDKLVFLKESIAQQQSVVEQLESMLNHVIETNSVTSDKSKSTIITGVRNLAEYIHKSPATTQKILNSNILQMDGIAYRIGNTWNINKERLDSLIKENPRALEF